jgi:putative transposase
MKAIAHERRRFGYRRLHVLLKRGGYVINHKNLFRLYQEEKLAVRRHGGGKRAIKTRAPMMAPMAPNDRWSLDFVSDQLADGRRFCIRYGNYVTIPA